MKFDRASVALLLLYGSFAGAAEAASPFDGTWATTLSCPDSHGALGYSFRFDSVIADGSLHGEKGTKGQAGWLSIDGPVSSNGDATLYVDGIVGAAPFAVGQRPAGTTYGYHVKTHFDGGQGAGDRVEGRPCTAVFEKEN
ncbi:MAG TPA: hypothetical protein VGU69_02270 [Rhizomicrobium sp.]|nr:hypothetical protein [Rhizomicrobium sp.]